MNEARKELAPLTAVQLLDAAIWREIASHEPQPQEAFVEALSRVLAHWMLTRSQAPEMETMIALCKTRAFVVNPEKLL
jgi:uncharacterized protein YjiS (DUF1127 family)